MNYDYKDEAWIDHDPNLGTIPSDYIGVKTRDGTEDFRELSYPKEFWNHTHTMKSKHIMQYIPKFK